MIKKLKSYQIHAVIGSILFLQSWFDSKDTLDINVHDTYFVITAFHLCQLLSYVFFFWAGIYFLMKIFEFKESKSLTWAYFITIFLGVILIIGSIVTNNLFIQEIDSIYPYMEGLLIQNTMIIVGMLLILSTQIIFAINVCRGITLKIVDSFYLKIA